MILGGLDIYKHHTFTWYHWFGPTFSRKKLNFLVFRLSRGSAHSGRRCPLGGPPQVRPLTPPPPPSHPQEGNVHPAK